MSWIIYKHTNNINGKSYIGLTSQTLEERSGIDGKNYLRKHGKDRRYMHPAFAQAIIKYGWDNFSHEVLCEVDTIEEAKQKEIEYISLYDSKNNGYNCTSGGEDCQDPDIRERAKQSWHNNPENEEKTRQQMINFRKQEGFVENMMAHNWVTQEQFDNASQRMKIRNADPEYQKKCREARLRKLYENPEYREEIRLKLVTKRGKKVKCLTTGECYNSLADAERATGVNRHCISKCCAGILQSAGKTQDGNKMHWEYYKESGDSNGQS